MQKIENFFFYEQTDSTNNRAKEYSGSLPAIFQADMQTSGRGRMGRSFYSPKKCGIYISYLIEMPKIPFSWITPFASVAVANTIDFFLPENSEKCKIKWVNDVYLNEKKVCGILTEGILDENSNKISKIVIGIGINLDDEENERLRFPEELSSIAGTCKIPSKKRSEVVEKLTENLFSILEPINQNGIDKRVCEYKKRSNLIGKEVDVVPTVGVDYKFSASVIDISDECYLVVEKLDESREKIFLSTGEVSIRF